MIINRIELVRQRINPRDREAKVGIVFLRERNPQSLDAELHEARVTPKAPVFALHADGG